LSGDAGKKTAKRIPALEQRERDVEVRELGERRRRAQAAGLDVLDLRDEVLRDVDGDKAECLRGGVRRKINIKMKKRRGGRGEVVVVL
jgi:hypothetical protein